MLKRGRQKATASKKDDFNSAMLMPPLPLPLVEAVASEEEAKEEETAAVDDRVDIAAVAGASVAELEACCTGKGG